MPEKKPKPKPIYRNTDSNNDFRFSDTSAPSTNLAHRWATGTNRIGNTPLQDAGQPVPKKFYDQKQIGGDRGRPTKKGDVWITEVPKNSGMLAPKNKSNDLQRELYKQYISSLPINVAKRKSATMDALARNGLAKAKARENRAMYGASLPAPKNKSATMNALAMAKARKKGGK
jgi:hypothetical protein